MKQSQIELNELLTEYWKLRYSTGACCVPRASVLQLSMSLMSTCRGVYGDAGEQVGDAGHGDVICKAICMSMCTYYVRDYMCYKHSIGYGPGSEHVLYVSSPHSLRSSCSLPNGLRPV